MALNLNNLVKGQFYKINQPHGIVAGIALEYLGLIRGRQYFRNHYSHGWNDLLFDFDPNTEGLVIEQVEAPPPRAPLANRENSNSNMNNHNMGGARKSRKSNCKSSRKSRKSRRNSRRAI